MHIIKKISLAVPSLALASGVLVGVPVFAQRGSADAHPVRTTSTTDTTVATTQTTDTSTEDTGGGGGQSALHQRGAQIVADLEKNHPSGKSAQQRAQICENRRHGLETKFTRITTNSQNLEDRIGTFLTKAEDYQTTNSVTVDNWSTLTGNADTAKTAVDTAIANLKAVTPQTVDCTSSTVAQDVATFKAAASTVRDSLQAYKQAVIKVFTALQGSKNSTGAATTTDTNTTTTEGSNQ